MFMFVINAAVKGDEMSTLRRVVCMSIKFSERCGVECACDLHRPPRHAVSMLGGVAI